MPTIAERYWAIQDVATFIEQRDLAPAHVAGLSEGATNAMAPAMTWLELVHTIVLVVDNCSNDE
ncbi:MAG: hypothetical protein M3464_03215 [Chloroflexota bacterium]|nr:hypothetical protein [Chloroflexota bacterium]